MIGLVGPQRLGQEHAGQPDLPLLRRDRRRHPGRRHRHPPLRRGRLPPPHRPGAAGAVPVLRHHRARTSPTASPTPRARRSSPRRAPPMRTTSSCACRTATTRWSASAGRACRAASGSASRIARALLIDPRILILDEATSAVDTETEKEIQKALDNLVQGRTTIAIAHRLSTLRKADRLVVMDRGEIVEVGPHDELMERQGAYWRLYQAQLRQADDEERGRGGRARVGGAGARRPCGPSGGGRMNGPIRTGTRCLRPPGADRCARACATSAWCRCAPFRSPRRTTAFRWSAATAASWCGSTASTTLPRRRRARCSTRNWPRAISRRRC